MPLKLHLAEIIARCMGRPKMEHAGYSIANPNSPKTSEFWAQIHFIVCDIAVRLRSKKRCHPEHSRGEFCEPMTEPKDLQSRFGIVDAAG